MHQSPRKNGNLHASLQLVHESVLHLGVCNMYNGTLAYAYQWDAAMLPMYCVSRVQL